MQAERGSFLAGNRVLWAHENGNQTYWKYCRRAILQGFQVGDHKKEGSLSTVCGIFAINLPRYPYFLDIMTKKCPAKANVCPFETSQQREQPEKGWSMFFSQLAAISPDDHSPNFIAIMNKPLAGMIICWDATLSSNNKIYQVSKGHTHMSSTDEDAHTASWIPEKSNRMHRDGQKLKHTKSVCMHTPPW